MGINTSVSELLSKEYESFKEELAKTEPQVEMEKRTFRILKIKEKKERAQLAAEQAKARNVSDWKAH